VNNFLELDEHQQQLADYYSRRSNTYDEGDFHPQLAHSLIEYAGIQRGHKILDIATGTGLVAIEAAKLVGAEGRVAGADISTGMLEQAKRKIEAANLNNIELILAPAEDLNFPDSSFDTVLCCSALILLANIPAALRSWHRLLKPGGLIAFNGFAETSFIAGVVLSQVAHKYGVEFAFNRATGSAHKCGELLRDAGFEDVEIKTDRGGNYLNLTQAKALWDINLKHPLARPLLQLESEQLERVKAEYCAELEALVTDKGIWNDITTFTALGRKKASST
jgi:ubiquinone/menaquinone biosynthesis C-methylase UbiE